MTFIFLIVYYLTPPGATMESGYQRTYGYSEFFELISRCNVYDITDKIYTSVSTQSNKINFTNENLVLAEQNIYFFSSNLNGRKFARETLILLDEPLTLISLWM